MDIKEHQAKELIDARTELYNHLMDSNVAFSNHMMRYGSKWRKDNALLLDGLLLRDKQKLWSKHIHTGVVDEIIAKYI